MIRGPDDLNLPVRLSRARRTQIYWAISKGVRDMLARDRKLEEEKSMFAMTRVMWTFGFTGKVLVIGLWLVGLMVAAAVIAEIMLWGAITSRIIELRMSQ
jgi:hypothetical protein